MNIIYIYVYSQILLIWLFYMKISSFLYGTHIGQFVHSVGVEWMVYRMRMGGIILGSCEYNFIRVHKNLVQYPCNNISITII